MKAKLFIVAVVFFAMSLITWIVKTNPVTLYITFISGMSLLLSISTLLDDKE